jgi:hypothetical protein
MIPCIFLVDSVESKLRVRVETGSILAIEVPSTRWRTPAMNQYIVLHWIGRSRLRSRKLYNGRLFRFRYINPEEIQARELKNFPPKHRSLREIIFIVNHSNILTPNGGCYELVEARDETERADIGRILFEMLRSLNQVEDEVSRVAELKYLKLNSGDIDPNTSEEALRKYHGEVSLYKKPLLKLMGLAKGGVRL